MDKRNGQVQQGQAQHRIGIYGGGFDPVHNTHLHLAKTVTEYLHLDQLIWVPTGVAWHKERVLSQPDRRVQMLELAFQSVEDKVRQKWRISTCEIKRSKDSYTIDTLKFLQNENQIAGSQWYVVMGADQFTMLHTWQNWPELLSRCTLAVVVRQGIDFHIDAAVLGQAHWVAVPFELSTTSSSQVRRLVRQGDPKAQKQLAQLLPQAVLDYIQQHQLYTELNH